jgi:hypothetical protein
MLHKELWLQLTSLPTQLVARLKEVLDKGLRLQVRVLNYARNATPLLLS